MIVSQATLRFEHLAPAFLDALYYLAEQEQNGGYPHTNDAKQELMDIAAHIDDSPFTLDDIYDEDSRLYTNHYDDAFWFVDALFDALNNAAPDFCYFSAHPGDGALFGFWPLPCTQHEDEEWPREDCPDCQHNVELTQAL